MAEDSSPRTPNGGCCAVDRVWLSYDHPFHAQVEHAVSVDFVDGSRPSGQRVAVELTRDAARQLALDLLAVADQADAYEAGLTA